MFIRDEWVKKSEFHPHSTREVLNEVIERCKTVLSKGKLPVVIFDLDSTLFDVSNRSYEILREWLSHPGTESYAETLQHFHDLKPEDMRYSLQETWEQKRINHLEEPYFSHLKSAKDFWRKRFFGNEYLKHDRPTDGAIQFVHKLYELGVYIVYLTGRDVPLMSFGTFDQLKEHKLPIEVERTRLILKPKRHLDDLEYKTNAVKTVSEWGQVVATFENEPKNLIAMASALGPDAMNIFIHSVSSDHPAPAGKGIYRIESFKID